MPEWRRPVCAYFLLVAVIIFASSPSCRIRLCRCAPLVQTEIIEARAAQIIARPITRNPRGGPRINNIIATCRLGSLIAYASSKFAAAASAISEGRNGQFEPEFTSRSGAVGAEQCQNHEINTIRSQVRGFLRRRSLFLLIGFINAVVVRVVCCRMLPKWPAVYYTSFPSH